MAKAKAKDEAEAKAPEEAAPAEEVTPGADDIEEPTRAGDRAEEIAGQPDFDPDADPLEKFNPDNYRPGDDELVVRHEEDVFRVLSVHDELQIIDEIQGRALDAMVYSFPAKGGGMTTGLSYKGVAEVVRTLNSRGFTRIRINPDVPARFEKTVTGDGAEAWQCTVYAEDQHTGGGGFGTFVQPAEMQLKNGSKVPDPFSRTKALSKAQRNAFEPLTPLELVEALKAQYIGQGRIKRIPQASPEPSDVTPALTDDRAKAQVERCQAIYDEIKAVNRAAMVPGAFNRLIVQSQHDHDALDRTIATLEDFLEKEREIDTLASDLRGYLGPENFDKAMEKIDTIRSQTGRLDAVRKLADEHAAE